MDRQPSDDSDAPDQQLWRPKDGVTTALDTFRKQINKKLNLKLENYKELHRWSCDEYAAFWEEVWKYCDIIHSQPYSQVVDVAAAIQDIPQWFSGAHLNYAENLLRYNDDRIALYCAGEGQELTRRTFHELQESVARYACAMRRMGVVKGDRIVGYLPNCSEAIEAMLAAASIGAIWSSTSPDFGVIGVLERFSQIHPKLLLSVNAVRYNGKVHNHLHKLQQVVNGLQDLEKVVVVEFVQEASCDISTIPFSYTLDEFLATSDPCPELTFEPLPFNHPLFIMYSSGTTGVPKCMVHSVGGTLIKHLQEHILQSGMTRNDVILFYTKTSWMMWNWLVSCLAVGCAVVLYDGSPVVPNHNVLWDLADQTDLTIIGMGAQCFTMFEDNHIKPANTHHLTNLRMIMSTGSPLKPTAFDYIYRDIKRDMIVASIAGGTDIIACFMGQNETVPVYRGEIQSLHLGCDIQTWNEQGQQVFGESGELVALTPFPSMPVYFWNDPDGLKYRKAYFAKFNGVWAHGDFCRINPATGGIVMLGRSDGTLNPNGIRFGTAEIYNIVEPYTEIHDCVCVSQRSHDKCEERVVLFVKMAPPHHFSNDLVCRICSHIRSGLSAKHVPAVILPIADIPMAPPHHFSNDLVCRICSHIRSGLSAKHVPAVILPIADIPYTLSGKKVEIAVRQTIMGQEVIQRAAIANASSLDLYRNIPQLAGY